MKDFSKDDLSIGVIGAGVMGRGILQIAASAGIKVTLFDLNEEAVEEAIGFVRGMLDRAVEKGRMEAEKGELAKSCISSSSTLQSLADSDLVIEAIIENIEIKQKLFRELEEIVSADCILATNTSSLSVTSVATAVENPQRVAGFHFFNPVPLMKLVEVIKAIRTEDEVCHQLQALTVRLGHTPVAVNDSPGFLVNHAGRGLLTEGLRILYENICDVQTVDSVMRDCAGFRMGPFELMDLTGLDVTFPASEQVYMQYFQEPRVRPTPLQKRRYVAGLLGRKTGEGFYRYEDGQKIVPERIKPRQVQVTSKVWLSPAYSEQNIKVRELLEEFSIELDEGRKPGKESLVLVTPLGLDVSSSIIEEALPAERTIGIDTLFDLDKHVVLMSSPATSELSIQQMSSIFISTGREVSVIKDSAGFIVQRIIATIINIACDIAQQGIARPEDIDTGAKLALAYPRGPLEFGDKLGAETILLILENLQKVYGDPRYRPSPWLRRRAQLKLSLLTEE